MAEPAARVVTLASPARRGRLAAALDTALELARDAVREIGAHQVRSVLTLSGIVFGCASVVAMTSLAAAVKTMAYEELQRMGLPRSFSLYDGSDRSDSRRAADLMHPGLKAADLEALRRVPGVESVYGNVAGQDMIVATPLGQRRLQVRGVDAGYLEQRNWPVIQGRTLVPLDIIGRSRVAVVGSALVEDLFGSANPVGRILTIDGVRFTVVGVNAPLPLEFIPADFSFTARRIYIPYTYLSRYQMGEGRVGSVTVTVAAGADFPSTMQSGRAALRQRHGVEDFNLRNDAAEVAENLALADNVLKGWNGVLFTIAGVTMIVGGIGLFSVLLISVRERVREIGIRKALGADDEEIKALFLAEALTLAASGALVGIAGGAGLIFVTQQIAQQFGRNFTIPINVPGVAMSVFFAVVVGLLFGWYPARRASRFNPIEAIYEV